jgi:hypothetical protein
MEEALKENNGKSAHSWILIGMGIFGMLWIIARACLQSITIDEADTFLMYVLRPVPHAWDANANNHILNSLLIRLTTMVFGASQFTLRLPALMGAAIYIVSAYYLVRLITQKLLLQWSLFTCLVFSPFIMDYLVAARGYALALAFLTGAVTIAAWQKAGGISLGKGAALISACMALSVSANLSFAVADAVTIILIILWLGRTRDTGILRTLAAFVLPGLAITYFFLGSVLQSWSHNQFVYGASSLKETGQSILRASLVWPNEYLLNPQLRYYFVECGKVLYPLLGLMLLWRAVMLYRDRASAKGGRLALISILALLVTLACHQLLYSYYDILLPRGRTGLFLALFFLLMAGAAAASQLGSKLGRASGTAVTAALLIIAVYSISCLRLTYFYEWDYDAAIKKAYSVLAYYNHAYGLKNVTTNWRYRAGLDAYREMSGRESLGEIHSYQDNEKYPSKDLAYVLHYPSDLAFINDHKLKIVFHDQFTETTVAIRPELEARPPCTQ